MKIYLFWNTNWSFSRFDTEDFLSSLFQELSKLDKTQKVKYLLPMQFFQVSYHFSMIFIKFYKIPW